MAALGKFLAAVRFLTIVPVPGALGHQEEELLEAVSYFPVVGLLAGLGLYSLSFPIRAAFDPLLAAVILVILMAAISGALHLDGLADCCDGFFSSRPRERMLEIMRDSSTGVMGAAGVVMIFMLKTAALAGLSGPRLSVAVFLMPLAGRSLMLVMMALLPYARSEGGLATLFYQRSNRLRALWGGVLLLAASWYLAGLAGLLASFATLMVVLLFCAFCQAKIGGATGDTLGACTELAEAVLAVCLAAQPMAALWETP